MFNNILKLRTRTINLAPHEAQHANVRFGSLADIRARNRDVRSPPKADMLSVRINVRYVQ